MILQGVKLTIQPLGVGYANSPKKAKMGGYVAFSPIYACLASNNLCKVISPHLCIFKMLRMKWGIQKCPQNGEKISIPPNPPPTPRGLVSRTELQTPPPPWIGQWKG